MPDDVRPATIGELQATIDTLRKRVRVLEAEKADALAGRERALAERDTHRNFRRVKQRALDQANAQIAALEATIARMGTE